MSESRVIITAVADRAISEFRRFREQATGALETVSQAGGVIGGVLGAVGASLSIAAFTGWIKGAIDATDAASDLSQRIGVAVEDLAGLELAFQMGGMEASALEGAMTKLSKQIVDNGDAFAKLGISSKNLDGSFKSNKEMLYELADEFASMEEGVQKVALAQEVFGKSGAAMLPLLNGGSEGLREMDAMARQLGLSLSEEAVEHAGSFNDTLDLLMLGTQGVARGVAAELLPTLSTLAGQFLKTATQGDTLKNTAQFLASGLKLLYTVGVGIVEVFSTVGKTLGAGAAQLVAFIQGDFKMAAEIGRQWQADIGKSWSDTASSIAAAWGASGDASVEEMAAIVRHGTVVGKSAAEIAAETKKLNQEQQAQAKLLSELSGLSGTFSQEWEALSKAYANGAISVDQLTKAQADLLAKQPAIKAANDAAAKAAADEKKLLDEATAAVDRDIDGIVKQTEALELKIRTYGMLPEAITDVQIAELEAAKQSLVLSDAGVADIQRRIDALKGLRNAQAAATIHDAEIEAVKKLADEGKRMAETIESSLTDALLRGFENGEGLAENFVDTLKNMVNTLVLRPIIQGVLQPVSGALNGLGQSVLNQFGLGAVPGASGAGGAGVGSAISSVKGIYDAMQGGFAALGDTVAGFAQNIMSSMGYTPLASQGLATASGQALTPLANGLGAAAGIAGGVFGGVMGGRALSNGYSAFGGSGNSTVNAGTAIGAAVGTIVGPLGTALGSLVGGLLGGAVNRLFGHKPKEVVGSNLAGTLGEGGFDGKVIQEWKQKGGWFRSDKSGFDRVDVAPEMDQALSDAYGVMKVSTKAFAEALGVDASSIARRTDAINIAIGKTDAETQANITAYFEGLANTMATDLVPELANVQQKGESASAALQRLATSYAVIDDALASIGVTFGAVGVSSLAARERLLLAAGGLDAFASGVQFFQQNFLSETERNAPVLKAVTEQMAALGLASVDTRDEFKQVVLDLIDSGALATEEGAKRYAALMALQASFAQVYPAAESDAQRASAALEQRKQLQAEYDALTMTSAQQQTVALEQQRAALDESVRALFDQVQALKAQKAAAEDAKAAAATLLSGVDSAFATLQRVVSREKAALQASVDVHAAAVNRLQSLAQLLNGTLSSMSSPEQQLAQRAAAQAQIRAALAKAQAGGALPDADSLRDALSAVSRDASSQFSSYNDYLLDLYQTQNDIASLAGITDAALSVEERSLRALEDQLTRLDQIVENGQAQIDALNGQATGLLTLSQAVEALAAALGAAQANPIIGGTSAITDAYQQLLGRAPDVDGLAYWQDRLANGASQDAVIDSIKNSPEAQIKKLYGEVLDRTADAEGLNYWMDRLKGGISLDAIRDTFQNSDEAKKLRGIPGFATGGDFAGGWRIVGEDGPELEATGPARIFNANQTKDMFSRLGNPADNGVVLARAVSDMHVELARLRAENTQLRQEMNAGLGAIAKNTMDTADHLDAATRGSVPFATKVVVE
ncbi:DUF4214 domain-containing protein [Massilia sp. CFBP9026]|uniref:DUF4214 domain-containing protein n=1 Tax=Massilia sp. CFBP9026 TaxID=3096536 RepID=UPI002A6AD553|nr:DUF4214 domain-containing protein [Massilia sp. CFBP9026]MDY0965429.1 DUF4214 domain-containing protein [Massilia sp. CFBP9026]